MTISDIARQNVAEVPRMSKTSFLSAINPPSRLLGLLLELLIGSLGDTTALVDNVPGGGRLTRVHVADDDNVKMDLFLSHFRSSLQQILK